MKPRKTFRILIGAASLVLVPWHSDAAETIDIEASHAFHITGTNTGRHETSRMLAGGWPDNADWGLMRGMMVFDLSSIPDDSGIAAASLSIFTRKSGFSATNPEGTPGDLAIKDLGNLEEGGDFDADAANWATLDPEGGDVSGVPLSLFAADDYKADWPHGTEVLFPNTDAFADAVTRALVAGQKSLYLIVHCPDFDANPADGKHFYRLDGQDGAAPVIHVTVLGADSDKDGLEDEWELGFFPGDLTRMSSNGDADSDGLNDKGEFLAGSDPTNPDTDGDTISDGAEVVSWRSDPTKKDSDGDGLEDNTEIAEDPFLTDPASADSDEDGLDDGEEIALGTDPSNPDSDGDSYEDGLERRFGADPTDVSSVTGSLVRGGKWKVEMARGDITPTSADEVVSLLEGDGRIGDVQTTEWDVINFQVTVSVDAFFDTLTRYPILETPVAVPVGMRVSGGIFVRETGMVTLGFDTRPATGGELRIDGQVVELVAGANRQTGRAPHMASVQLEAGPHDVEFYHWFGGDTGMYMFSSFQNGSMETYDPAQMELMPAFDIANVMTEDSDSDGLDDFWENFYFGDLSRDGAGDEDGDGLTDKAESENRANPTKKDTDGDGLEDGPEVATHNTKPNLFDSDGDAISDGAEVTEHQTDPNKRDTDGDGIDDNIEITLGSTPTDAGSIPDTVVLLRDQSTGRSWQDGGFWSDGEPVSAGKTYQAGGVPGLGGTLRSPPSANPEFAGSSLALMDDSTLRLKHTGAAVFPPVTAQNTMIQQGVSGQTIGMGADITISESLDIDIQGENRGLNLSGSLAGTGNLVLRGVLGGQLSLDTPLSRFSGDIEIENISVTNAGPGSLRNVNLRVSGELWSDSTLNFAGKRLTLIGTEVGLQLDRDIYVKELYYQPDRESGDQFDLDGLLGDDPGTPLSAEWFGDPGLGALNELILSSTGDPKGMIVFSDDSDSDGLPDVWENENGLDTGADDARADKDGDGLSNELEFYLATNIDGNDSDDDGLSDGDEYNLHDSDPSSKDSDGDGLEDGAEITRHMTSPVLADTDSDGLSDPDEINTHGTDPNKLDSDGDGVHDGVEVAANTDPTDPNSAVGVWTVRTVESSAALNSVADTEALFGGANVLTDVTTQHLTINFLGTGGDGNYAENEIFPNMTVEGEDLNDFAILVTGKFTVDTAGIYTIGFNTDDGGQVQVDGTVVAEFDANRGAADTLGQVELTAGEHDLRFLMWERGGGSAAELFLSNQPASLDAFDEGRFHLIEAGVSGPVVVEGPTPPLTSVLRTPDGVSFTIPVGETYDIEYSPDLINWTPVEQGQSGDFKDTDAGRTRAATGFYRGMRR